VDITAEPSSAEGSSASRAPSEKSVNEALDIVREHGGRVTSCRRVLLGAIFGTREHRTAEELTTEVHAKLPDVHPSTIYRNLEELERLGIIVHSHIGHGPAMYHLTSAAHGHLVCEECGAMTEVSDRFFRGFARSARSEFGFTIDPHHFAIPGRCSNCAEEP